MSENNEYVFEEKQYLGYNKFSLIRRLFLALFCFLVYFYSDRIPQLNKVVNSADLLFFMGIAVLIISAILVFILHLHTKVMNGSIVLDGLWTSRKVKIDLNSIVDVKKVKYSRYLFNRPVYNLHRRGRIKFFTTGNDAVELTDKDGLIYIIGSQRANELVFILQSIITKKSS
jgi:archaellum component FlaG (FlaF/FlaG flagellin family)